MLYSNSWHESLRGSPSGYLLAIALLEYHGERRRDMAIIDHQRPDHTAVGIGAIAQALRQILDLLCRSRRHRRIAPGECPPPTQCPCGRGIATLPRFGRRPAIRPARARQAYRATVVEPGSRRSYKNHIAFQGASCAITENNDSARDLLTPARAPPATIIPQPITDSIRPGGDPRRTASVAIRPIFPTDFRAAGPQHGKTTPRIAPIRNITL